MQTRQLTSDGQTKLVDLAIKKRKPYAKRSSNSSSTACDSESETEEANLLDDWDNWVDSDSDLSV